MVGGGGGVSAPPACSARPLLGRGLCVVGGWCGVVAGPVVPACGGGGGVFSAPAPLRPFRPVGMPAHQVWRAVSRRAARSPGGGGLPGALAYGGPDRPAPPLRAAILYRECSVLEHVLTAIGSRREHFSLASGLVPCAYSFATEKATVCHRLGSTTSIPSPGIRRRGKAAPWVLVP